jgi:uncharacterized protein
MNIMKTMPTNELKVSLVNNYNEKLVGIKSTPSEKQDKYPTVILIHGFGITKSEYGMFDALAAKLSQNGFLVFRFDFSGCGESEGNYSETSLTKLKSDLSEIIKFVKSQPEVDNSRIGILGQSLGTATTITLGPNAKSFVMLGSVSTPEDSLVEFFGEGYNPDGISTKKRSNGSVTKIKPQFWKDFENHNLLESVKNIKSPIIFIHGGSDQLVPITDMESYFKNANEPKEKIIIEGADHGLMPHRDKMYKIVIDWFKRTL